MTKFAILFLLINAQGAAYDQLQGKAKFTEQQCREHIRSKPFIEGVNDYARYKQAFTIEFRCVPATPLEVSA